MKDIPKLLPIPPILLKKDSTTSKEKYTMHDFRSVAIAYKKLPKAQREILKLLAVLYFPCDDGNFKNILKNTPGFELVVEGLKEGDLEKIRQELMTDGWLLKEADDWVFKPELIEYVMRFAVAEPIFETYTPVLLDLTKKDQIDDEIYQRYLRAFRIALYKNNSSELYRAYVDLSSVEEKNIVADQISRIFLPYDERWFGTYMPATQAIAMTHLIWKALSDWTPLDKWVQIAVKLDSFQEKNEIAMELRTMVFTAYLLEGKLKTLETYLEKSPKDIVYNKFNGVLQMLSGNFNKAKTLFATADLARELNKSWELAIWHIFHSLLLLKTEPSSYHHYLNGTFRYFYKIKEANIIKCLIDALPVINPFNSVADKKYKPRHPLAQLLFAYAKYWIGEQIPQSLHADYMKLYEETRTAKYDWLLYELSVVLPSVLRADEATLSQWKATREALEISVGSKPLSNLFQQTQKWKQQLNQLKKISLQSSKSSATTDNRTKRLIWLIDFELESLHLREQSLSKSGTWTKGKNIPIKKLINENIESATIQDLKIRKHINSDNYYRSYRKDQYQVDFNSALLELIGHPHVFLYRSPNVNIELVKKDLELFVEDNGPGFSIQFNVPFNKTGVVIDRETPTRYALYQVEDRQVLINKAIQFGNLTIPREGKEELTVAITALSQEITIQTDLLGVDSELPTVEADPRPYVHLLPIGDGFQLEFFVKPFGNFPPYFKPAEGKEKVIADIEETRTVAVRNIEEEQNRIQEIIKACPSLNNPFAEKLVYEFDHPEACLEVLLELEPFKKDEKIVMEYPKGEKLRLIGYAGMDNLSIAIQRNNNWFGVDGELRVDGKKLLEFQQLIEAAKNTDSRFIQLSDGAFLAITRRMQAQLNDIHGLVQQKKNGLQLHPLSIGAFDEFAAALDDFRADKAWTKQLQKIRDAKAIDPKIPDGFQAALRTYQQEGFKWLCQLAHWGVGACLADDMGLGKTVQTLALLLHRASEGPALVVAPASVARNWLSESQKFAPALRTLLFGPGDRNKMIKHLQPYDLLICSYGLLQQEIDLIEETQFSTIILDEAQAIKNKNAKRTKAVMQLQGGFRILTTGTPVENHLGELWSLFQFINPGLLGSFSGFREKFALPIERDQNEEQRAVLKKLIQPFILRRRKSEVLSELPPKTEITLTVELSPDERALYEALRQSALATIENTNPHTQRFAILAELMKLRQAACHPKMVFPDSKISSSKLKLFGQTLAVLLENGHKALVFSQFVKHLKLIEKYLKKQKVKYQYLDGSTPLPRRQKAIDAFQSGQGDVFLISLKAGGTGLNLTAADYVIHLDPWWNPAVEDQASDRAHRMGQTRPVTIYRLVAENTIEDKIVSLHAEKRDLADSLLDGTELSAKLSAQDLLNLMKGE